MEELQRARHTPISSPTHTHTDWCPQQLGWISQCHQSPAGRAPALSRVHPDPQLLSPSPPPQPVLTGGCPSTPCTSLSLWSWSLWPWPCSRWALSPPLCRHRGLGALAQEIHQKQNSMRRQERPRWLAQAWADTWADQHLLTCHQPLLSHFPSFPCLFLPSTS